MALLAREEITRQAFRDVLGARFGPVQADVLEAIKPLDEDKLRELLLLAATAPLEEVRARLGLS